MRRFLVALLLLFTLVFFLGRVAEVQDVWQSLGRGDGGWILLGAILQAGWLLNVAVSFRAIYRLLGIEEDIEHLLHVAAAANFVNVVTPSMGMGGMAVFVTDGQRRGLPSGRVTTAVALYVVYDYLAFLAVLSLGLLILFQRNQLNFGEILAAGIFAVAALILGAMVLAGMRSAAGLESLLVRLGTLVNRALRPFLRRDYLDLARAHIFAYEVAEGLQEARRSRGGLLLPAVLALNSKLLLILILFLVFLAFGLPFSIGTLVAGFSIGYLFVIVSPTPSGIGFVEGALALGLNSLGIPLGSAAIVALAYRGITFWLPLLYGMLAFRFVGRGQPALPD